MSRLIDDVSAKKAITDYLMKCVDNNKFSVDVTEVQIAIINVINGLPTAYSVEKVVTELEVEKERHDTDRSYWAEHEWKDRVIYNECDMSDKKSNCFDLSINIVKRGGVE